MNDCLAASYSFTIACNLEVFTDGAAGNCTSSWGKSRSKLLRLTLYVSPSKDIASDWGIASIAFRPSSIDFLNSSCIFTNWVYSSFVISGLLVNILISESNVIFLSLASFTFFSANVISSVSFFPLLFKSLTG